MLVLLLSGCIKDEPLNQECDILSVQIDDPSLERYFYNQSDMTIQDVPSTERQLTFVVRSLSQLPDMPVSFTLTPGATVAPASGTVQNFRNGAVQYTVTSEDGQWTKTYSIQFVQNSASDRFYYDFESYQTDTQRGKYYEWVDDVQGPIWATGNDGYYIAKSAAAASDYPTVPDADGYVGNCVRLVTRDTGSWGKTFRKPIAAGNLFLGKFNSQYALINTLKTTEMGIPFDRQPQSVTGFYKYKAGAVFTDKNFSVVADRKDEPAIYAVFYRNTDAAGQPVMLHGDDVKTHPNIVGLAEVTLPSETDEWTRFEMTFPDGMRVDPAILANRGYNLALVFSSSKTGDTFEGAVGSTLCIDEVEIHCSTEQ